MPSELKTERHGSILVLTIGDPATRNTLCEQLLAAGIAGSIPAIILRGDGPHFGAGEDLLLAERLTTMAPKALASAKELLHQPPGKISPGRWNPRGAI